MRIGVVGSRSFADYDLLCRTLDQYEGITEIISGGARGADTLAEMYARHRALPVKVFPAEWDKYGKSAGFRRNADIVKNSDIIVAFWDGKSKGTKHTIDLARRYFKEVKIIKFGA